MDAQALVPDSEVRVIAPARAAGVGEDEDALVVVHERGCFDEVGRRRAVLHGEPLALAHHAPRASCHLGDHIGAEALDDLVERARDRRQQCEAFD